MRIVSVVALVAALAACAPTARIPSVDAAALQAEAEFQQQLAARQHLADTRQLHRIAYPLLAANAPLCGPRLAWGSGLLLDGGSAAAGAPPGLTVVAVAPGSPAARAGIAEDDRIVAVAGVALAPGRRAPRDAAALFDQAGDAALSVTLARAGTTHAVTLVGERVCDMPYRVAISEAINAYADGRGLAVTSGLMRFLGGDADIAVIVGHEMAHNVMGHITSGVGHVGIAALYDFLGFGGKPERAATGGAPQPINQAFESEADYVGLYLMARAGFALDAAPQVYRRFAVAAPSSIVPRAGATHPSSPARVVMLRETAREIAAKRAAGAPLVPDRN